MTPNKENQCCESCWITSLTNDDNTITPVSEPFCSNPFCPCHTTEKVEEEKRKRGLERAIEIAKQNEAYESGRQQGVEDVLDAIRKLTNPTNPEK